MDEHQFRQDQDPEIRKLVQRFFESERPVGVAVGTVQRTPDEIARGFHSAGTAREGGEEPTPLTIWQVGSSTKTFTATILAWALRRGGMALDDVAQQFAPQGAKIPTYESWNSSIPIRLVELATHTASLPLDPGYVPAGGYREQEMYEYLSRYALALKPSTSWNYSNVGYGLLANLLMEHDNVDSYAVLLSEFVAAAEIELPDTRISVPIVERDRQAWGYCEPSVRAPWRTSTWPAFYGSGALSSTVTDMVAWLEFNLGLTASPLTDVIDITQRVYFDDPPQPMGLAWERDTFGAASEPCWSKGGYTNGFSSFITLSRPAGAGVVVLCNSSWVWSRDLAQHCLTLLVAKGVAGLSSAAQTTGDRNPP